MNPIKNNLSTKMIECLSSTLFPEVDTLLRAGKHLCAEDIEKHSFIHDYFNELDSFYSRYHVELIRAPEDFFYLRTKSTSIIASSQLTELEMLVGKVLCLLYLSPERIAQQGIFTVKDVYDELVSLVEVERLVKIINPRSTGSDLDKAKFNEKLRSSLNRLARIGMITYLPKDKTHNKFFVRSATFRFGNEVRMGEDARLAQEKLIRTGEIVTKEVLEQRKEAEKMKEDFATSTTNNEDLTQESKVDSVTTNNLSSTTLAYPSNELATTEESEAIFITDNSKKEANSDSEVEDIDTNSKQSSDKKKIDDTEDLLPDLEKDIYDQDEEDYEDEEDEDFFELLDPEDEDDEEEEY